MSLEQKKTNYRWVICGMLFLATTINYMDRQVLSLTWKDFIAPEFHWTDADYGNITAIFGLVYAIANLFSGRFMDWIGVKKGYLWAIAIWSLGACMHAFCGLATMWHLNIGSTQELFQATGSAAIAISTVSAYCFIVSRIVLGIGESGNFPAAIKVTAEYFPKKDRAFATSIFNSGSTIGALVAPISIPLLARYFKDLGVGNGWEMAFIVIGALGFIWLGFWLFLYKKPEECKRVNEAELAYIQQDSPRPQPLPRGGGEKGSSQLSEESLPHRGEVGGGLERSIPFIKFLTFPQTWGIFFAKLLTDGVWWFFLFWTPAYISDIYGLPSDNPTAILLISVLYAITMLSIFGGKLPTIIINRTGQHPYDARLKAMFLFTLFPLLILFAQPLGAYSYWFPIILIGLAGAAHQSWSANLFSVASDLFPKKAVGTMTGINGMAGGIGSFLINLGSGILFTFAAGSFVLSGSDATTKAQEMNVKNYKQVLIDEAVSEGDASVTAKFAALNQKEADEKLEKRRDKDGNIKGGSTFNETKAKIAIINTLTGEQLKKDEKAETVIDKYDVLADKARAEEMMKQARETDAKAEIVVNMTNKELFKELAGDGDKLAEAFKQHKCEVRQAPLHFLGFSGKPAGYFLVFCYCAVAYLLGWLMLKAFVPKYKAVKSE